MKKDREEERRQRVNQIKKTIIGMIVAVIVLLCIVCVVLGIKLYRVSSELKESRKQTDVLSAINEAISTGVISYDDLMKGLDVTNENEDVQESDMGSIFGQDALLAEDDGLTDADPYYIYLTFDDGPSSNTQDILTILREYGVKATFFVNGRTDEESLRMYGDIVQAGHTLGMHSYSHKYDEIYSSSEMFETDLRQIGELIYDTTGYSPKYYRFPGGSSNTAASGDAMKEFADILHDNGVEYVDWNVDSGDGSGRGLKADELVENVFRNFGKYHKNVVLMHDGAGHEETVAALPRIIERARNMGAELLPITDSSAAVQHKKNKE